MQDRSLGIRENKAHIKKKLPKQNPSFCEKQETITRYEGTPQLQMFVVPSHTHRNCTKVVNCQVSTEAPLFTSPSALDISGFA